MVSLPIPDRHSLHTYADLRSPIARYATLGDIVDRMPRATVQSGNRAHIDPDLDSGMLMRHEDWRPLFGQTGSAQAHLANNGIRPGDLFLMFGWFREADESAAQISWTRGSRDQHVVFGWMQIAEILTLGPTPNPPAWAAYHPHAVQRAYGTNNTLYVAAKKLSLPGVDTDGIPGAGVFRRYDDARQLTSPAGRGRSNWLLPAWFDPGRSTTPLTYHPDPARWRRTDDGFELDTVGRGQEFIFDCDVYPESLEWFVAMCHRERRAVA